MFSHAVCVLSYWIDRLLILDLYLEGKKYIYIFLMQTSLIIAVIKWYLCEVGLLVIS